MFQETNLAKIDREFWLRWVAANALAEGVGLGGIFVMGFFLFSRFGQEIGATPVLLLATSAVLLGTFEGVLVGAAQWWVLRRRVPTLTAHSWIGASAAGAFLAWTLGMVPSTLIDFSTQAGSAPPPEPPAVVVLLLAAVMGAVAGPVLAGAQWIVLRRYVTGAWRWMPANALAWAVAMPVVFLAPERLADSASGVAAGALAIGIVALAGGIVGTIHGTVLVRLLDVRKMSLDGGASPRGDGFFVSGYRRTTQ